MANPNEQTPGPQQPHPQQGQPPQPQQQTPQPGQQPNPQQGQLNQQQLQFQQQQQQQQQQQRAAVHAQQRNQQVQAQRMQAQAQAQAQAQQRQVQGGVYILKLSLFAGDLSDFNAQTGKDLNAWNGFVDKHFAEGGRLLHSFADDPTKPTKTYEVLRPTIARYFWSYFESGAQSLRLHTELAREQQTRNSFQVNCSRATLTVSYPTGARLEMTGGLNALFAQGSDMIECLEIQQAGNEEIISRSEVEKVLNGWPSPETKSPRMTKNKLPKAQQKLQQQFDRLTIDAFPRVPKGTMGVTSRVQHFLEVCGREV